jgi:predicted metal-dependent hydrolase
MPSWWQLTLDWFGRDALAPTTAPAFKNGPGFQHPQANRTLDLSGVPVAYRLVRCQRRSIGFVIRAEGLEVRAPKWVTLSQMEGALRERSPWILKKLQETQQRQTASLNQAQSWGLGTVFPLHGHPIVLRGEPADSSEPAPPKKGVFTVWPTWQEALASRELVLPKNWERKAKKTAEDPLREVVLNWVRDQSQGYFVSRLNHFAPQLAVRWTALSLSQARTRWGTARQDGAIRLNWRLMHLSPDLIDYVVVHELSHLRVMNHSPQFWATVASVLPDVHQLRRRLRDSSVP